MAAKRDAEPGSALTRPAAKRVRNYKKHAKKELSEAFPEIVDVLIERAKEGSLTHAKLLFELGGVKDEHVSRARRGSHPSLAEILLKEVAKRGKQAEQVNEPRQTEGQALEQGPGTAAMRSEDEG